MEDWRKELEKELEGMPETDEEFYFGYYKATGLMPKGWMFDENNNFVRVPKQEKPVNS